MVKQIEVNVPDWFEQNGLNVLTYVQNPIDEQVGILLASESLITRTEKSVVVRVYLLQLLDGQYEVVKEIESYPFNNLARAKQFAERLPNLNVIDFLLSLNHEEPALA